MDSHIEDALLRWSVRIAVLLYLGRVWTEWNAPGSCQNYATLVRRARWLWTIGGLFYFAHVLYAFAFVHHWSHAQAYRHTAEQTAAMTGIHWGGGLHLNYVLTLIWLVDIAAWWSVDVQFPYRSKIYFILLHSFFAFMVFQATVVFGPVWWKCFALLAAVAVGGIECARARQRTKG